MLVSESHGESHKQQLGIASTTPSSASTSFSSSSTVRAPSPVPETIFGWPALFTAIQSILVSLPIFRRLFVSNNSVEFQPQVEDSPQHVKSPMATSVEISSQVPTVNIATTETSSMTAVKTSADVTMLPMLHSNDQVNDESTSKKIVDSMVISPNSRRQIAALSFESLPDELIAMCYADLSAEDLVALEQVSRRLRHLVAYDSMCWKRCTEARWGHLSSNSVILAAAARHAGTWKQLYAEKATTDLENVPWITLCKSETRAILDIIKGEKGNSSPPPAYWPVTSDDPTPSSPPKEGVTPLGSSSPCSVMTNNPPLSSLSVVVLIDASSSVTDDDFDAMKTFAKALVENLRVSHPESSVAVVQFNQHPKVEVSLINVCKAKLSTSIENMEQLMGSTDIAAPIRKARMILGEEAGPGDRAIVLLTDGQTHADELQESEREARKAFEEVGARLYTLGVGRDIDEVGLGRVARGSSGGMHFTLRRLLSSK